MSLRVGLSPSRRPEMVPEQALILPDDTHDRALIANVHPPGWANPEPARRYNLVVLGAGHGYKFASVLGRIAAELSVDGATISAPELEAFRIDRPLLREPDPPTSWMV